MKPRWLHFEQLELRTLLSTVGVEVPTGSSGEPTAPLVAIDLEVTDHTGQLRTSFQTGEKMLLNIYVEDLRADAHGVFAGLLDVLFDDRLVIPSGPPIYGEQYPNFHLASDGTSGVLDEIGAIGGLNEPGPGRYLLMQVPLTAISAGDITFIGDPADQLPDHEVLVFGNNFVVDPAQIEYGSVTVQIVGSPWPEPVNRFDGAVSKGPIILVEPVTEIPDGNPTEPQDPPWIEPPVPTTYPGDDGASDISIEDVLASESESTRVQFMLDISASLLLDSVHRVSSLSEWGVVTRPLGTDLDLSSGVLAARAMHAGLAGGLVGPAPATVEPALSLTDDGAGDSGISGMMGELSWTMDFPIGTAPAQNGSAHAASVFQDDVVLMQLASGDPLLPWVSDDPELGP